MLVGRRDGKDVLLYLLHFLVTWVTFAAQLWSPKSCITTQNSLSAERLSYPFVGIFDGTKNSTISQLQS